MCRTGADAAVELLDLLPIVLKELDAIPTKVAYFRTLCDSMGIPVIDDPLEQELTSYFRILAQSMHELP